MKRGAVTRLTLSVAIVVASGAACTSEDVTSVTAAPAATVAATVAPVTTAPVTIIATTAPPTTLPTGTTPATTSPAPTTQAPTTVPPAAPVRVLITNDDGYSSAGIDAVVQALLAFDVPVFDVTVVAPLSQQSDQGGNVTDGPVVASDVTTLSGHPAKAVDGFPADSVRWALDQGGIDFVPDFVISGTNEGQTLGPFVDVSGTVGAARAAAVRNVPAIAISTGVATFDYAAAVDVLVEYLASNLDTLLAHEPGSPVAEVISINVPSCSTGEVRGLVEVPLGSDLRGFDAAVDVDCSSTVENPADDVQAFFNGFAAVSPTPLEPAGG